MKETDRTRSLEDKIASRLQDGDVAGAWAAILDMVALLRRSTVPIELARESLAECLESLRAFSLSVGRGGASRLADAAISEALAGSSLDVMASDFHALAWRALRLPLIAHLVERRRPRLESIAVRKVHHPDRAPGVVQEAAIRLMAQPLSACTVEDIERELCRLVRNQARSRARRRFKRARRFTSLDGAQHFLGFEPDLEAAVTVEELDELAARVLSPKLHSVYELRRGDLSPAQIAETLGIAPQTERYRWKRAREQLREALAARSRQQPED